jgi:hypothetical protein
MQRSGMTVHGPVTHLGPLLMLGAAVAACRGDSSTTLDGQIDGEAIR